MASTLSPKGFFGHTTEYETRSWTALDVPESVGFGDLFDPTFWKHHASKFKPGNLIRMRRVDGAWDVQLNVVAQVPGGLAVELWPKVPAGAAAVEIDAKSQAIEPQMHAGRPVPRVEHTPATKWRVIGLDGGEVSRGHPTKAEAESALKRYAAALGREIAA